jgi:hypothetical protein
MTQSGSMRRRLYLLGYIAGFACLGLGIAGRNLAWPGAFIGIPVGMAAVFCFACVLESGRSRAAPRAAGAPAATELKRTPRDWREGLDPNHPANAALLATCPVCGLDDPDLALEDLTWHSWPAHRSCAEWLGPDSPARPGADRPWTANDPDARFGMFPVASAAELEEARERMTGGAAAISAEVYSKARRLLEAENARAAALQALRMPVSFGPGTHLHEMSQQEAMTLPHCIQCDTDWVSQAALTAHREKVHIARSPAVMPDPAARRRMTVAEYRAKNGQASVTPQEEP